MFSSIPNGIWFYDEDYLEYYVLFMTFSKKFKNEHQMF